MGRARERVSMGLAAGMLETTALAYRRGSGEETLVQRTVQYRCPPAKISVSRTIVTYVGWMTACVVRAWMATQYPR